MFSILRRKMGAINLAQPINWASPINRGLVSWWLPLNQGANYGGARLLDLCNKNHGTLSNPTWAAGHNRLGALEFDGTDDVVDFSLTSYFPRTAGTLIASILPTTNSDIRTIYMWRIDGSNELGIVEFNGVFGLSLACQYNAGGTNRNIGASSLAANARYEVAYTWDAGAASIMKLYINGLEVGSQTGLGSISSSNPLYYRIGGSNNANEYFKGLFESVKLYERPFTESEVNKHYQDSIQGYPQTLNRLNRIFTFDVDSTSLIYPSNPNFDLFSSFIQGL